MDREGNRLKLLGRLGQSIWCDNVERRMITTGVFEKMIKEDGISGVTSNPTIFEKAIASSSDYDEDLARLAGERLDTEGIYWALVIKDIQAVADVFRPVFEHSRGRDGFISIEVNPLLANDTERSVEQAKELWRRVGRPNIMIKIPATPEGIPVIEQLLTEGINVNVTLIFSIKRYREVMDAYMSGLEKRLGDFKPISNMASVASFFVSRVDTETDRRIEEKIGQSRDEAEKKALRKLLGKAAVANSKLAYEAFEQVFSGTPFAKLKMRGAHVQRPLWASTSTKNPAYRDVLYVEELIGPDTVNTLPPATIEAFKDHGVAATRIKQGVEGAREVMMNLKDLGIDLSDVTDHLEIAGVKAFSDSYHKLIRCIEEKALKIGVKPK